MTQAKHISEKVSNGMHLDDLADNAKSLAADAKTFAHDAASTARGKLDAARETVGEMATRAADTAGRLSRQARGSAMKGADAVADFVRERPFVALGAAFIAGYVAISLIRRR